MMTEAEAVLREMRLACLGSGRLSAVVMDQSLGGQDVPATVMQCGGLTPAQVEGVRFERLTAPLVGWFRQRARRAVAFR